MINNLTIKQLKENQYTWLITGVAGFIGSHLLENLLRLNQKVIGIDNFITGHPSNLEKIKLGSDHWKQFTFYEADINDLAACQRACQSVDYVLHHAALSSVPLSFENPPDTYYVNVEGFLNLLIAAKNNHVKRFIYASSSAVYGDDEHLPKIESKIGRPLSPYAATKQLNEQAANLFAARFQVETIGLRYFNVFGPRQSLQGAYAAVIPLWIHQLLQQETVSIFGDGETTRDFCYIDNIVQANLLAALTDNPAAVNHVYNIATQHEITLNKLFELISQILMEQGNVQKTQPQYFDFRSGDIRHSLADITLAKGKLGYHPATTLEAGLRLLIQTILTETVIA